ncbi:ROK family protein [Pseudonocardia sp. MH-G8]|uniref:ROK family protein n=1 Tax=Pseudonocardia sp. MH-G8 TaxID=1854588 RepID=UPI000BA13895|nr:ROK family protein [Pseudonocardia sp. MH-G8]OZM75466.1 glucokinase [Pseudonocardia sp. MH-G8]
MPAALVAAIDIGGTKVDVAVAGSTGEILQRLRLPTRPAGDPDDLFRRLGAALDELRRRAGREIEAVGCTCPGIVRPDGILLAPNLPGWQDVALAEKVRELSRVDVVDVTNDVKAAALAEARAGQLRGAEPGLYLNVGTGIAAAVTVGGGVLQGAHQAGGEIAYFMPDVDDDNATAPEPALERIVGGGPLGEAATAVLGRPTTAAELYRSTDPVATALAHRALAHLAAALVNCCVLVDPERVALGGGLTGSADLVLPLLASALTRRVPFPPDLTLARFTTDASLHGALALALDALADRASRPGEQASPALMHGSVS